MRGEKMVYIIIVLLLKVVQSFYNKKSSNGITNHVMFLKYLAFRQFVSALLGFCLVLLASGGLSALKPDGLTVAFASMMAAALAVSTFSSLMAMKSGTMVLSSLFGMAGLFVPCIAGVFLFDEGISLAQVGGLLVFIASAYLLIGCSKQMYRNFSWKTMLLLLVSMLAEGCTMLAQKMFSFYVREGNAAVFNFYAFLFSTGLSLLLFGGFSFSFAKRGEKPDAYIPPRLLLYGLILSAAVLVISQVSTVASETVPAVVLFPLSNGGGLLICAVVSALVYKEKLTVRAVIGLILGALSLLIINFG